jgi:hypothetical protein
MDNRNTNDVGPDRDTVAGATGGTGGAVAGAALGSLVGPIGTIIGGLAGAVGGWWAGRALADSPAFTNDDDSYYQSHHQTNYASGTTANQSTGSRPVYNDVRPAYQLGHLAGVNPDYQSHSFDDVEPHLSSAYSTAGQNNWNDVRQYAQDAWSRGRQVGSERTGSAGTSGSTGGMGSMGAGMGGNAAAAGNSGMGSDATSFDGSSLDNRNTPLGDYGRTLRDGASNVGDRVSDALDDFKDRIDGNPASRPGRDETDRPGR